MIQKHRRRPLLCLVLTLALAAPAVRGEPLREVFRRTAQPGVAAGETVRVVDGPLQVELAPGWVLSAATGAEFVLATTEAGAPLLHVGTGPILLVDVARNTVVALPPGSYPVGAPFAPGGAGTNSAAAGAFERQEFRFGDYVLARQQEIDRNHSIGGAQLVQVTQVLLGFMTGFLPRSP